MNNDLPGAQAAPSRLGRILGLVALVAVIAIAAFILGWAVRPTRLSATALFQVARWDPNVMSDSFGKTLDEREFEIVKKTQIALLKSNFVLTSALRDPKIGGLSMIHSQADPVAWLQENLRIEFPENGEILSISLSGAEDQEHELLQIVDAVARAYKDEVIEKSRMERLSSRDLLARNLENINQEIKRKLDEFLDIARESGRPEGGGGQVLQQLGTKRLERVEDEIMRLESALAIDKEAEPKHAAIEERLKQLHKQQTDLTKELASRIDRSSDLEVRQRELEQLQEIASDMSVKLETMDIESAGPDRIQLVQPAVIARN